MGIPCAPALVIQPTPALPQLASHTPLQHQGIEACAMEPHRGQGPGRFCPPRIHIAHTFPAFSRDCPWPAPAGEAQDRLGRALGMGIASSSHGNIAGTERAGLERCARMHSADEPLDTRQGPQVQRAMEAMVGACGPWSLHRAGVDDDKAPPCGPRLHGGHGPHPPSQRCDPRTTGPQARCHRLVCHGLRQGRTGAGHRAPGWVSPTREEDHPQALRRCLDLCGPHQGCAGACHLHCLRGEVLQKCLKERIWIRQGQLHGHFSCRQQGKRCTSCSMPSSSMIYRLSWRLCPLGEG